MRYPPIVTALQIAGCVCIFRTFQDYPMVIVLFDVFWWLMVEILWDTRSNW